jgi:lipopolysaccharide assembly outer membrane protein LptD (OstA)
MKIHIAAVMFVGLFVVALASYLKAQSATQTVNPIQFRFNMIPGQVTLPAKIEVKGTAQRLDTTNPPTFSGDVLLNEVGGHIQVTADDVRWDASTSSFILQGNVRLSAAK